jgi:hypothetical protein
MTEDSKIYRPRSFRLWHLMTLVALVAVVLGAATQLPLVLVLLGVWIVTAYLVATAWDRYFRRTYESDRVSISWLNAIVTRIGWWLFFLSFSLFLFVFVGFIFMFLGFISQFLLNWPTGFGELR